MKPHLSFSFTGANPSLKSPTHSKLTVFCGNIYTEVSMNRSTISDNFLFIFNPFKFCENLQLKIRLPGYL